MEIGEANSVQIRKSARLAAKYAKNKVKYNTGKREYKRKGNKPKQAGLEYLKSMEPLELEQAKLVVSMAGVEIKGNVEGEVAKMVLA